MKLSIVIANRGDPGLITTLGGIARTCLVDMPEVIVVSDGGEARKLPPWVRQIPLAPGKTVGPGAARNIGILHATHDSIMILDAHMVFAENDWAAKVLAAVKENPRNIYCCRMPSMGTLNESLANRKRCFTGADFLWKARLPALNRSLMAAPQINKYPAGEVQCIMGANYGFSREWYIHGLRAPWQYLYGWGLDEECLSVTNWICGGDSQLLDVDIGHCLLGDKQFTKEEMVNPWVGRFLFCHTIPMKEDDREELARWTIGSKMCMGMIEKVIGKIKHAIDPRVQHDFLASQSRNIYDFMDYWGIDKSIDVSYTVHQDNQECAPGRIINYA